MKLIVERTHGEEACCRIWTEKSKLGEVSVRPMNEVVWIEGMRAGDEKLGMEHDVAGARFGG
jgi:hypothetical protein